MAEFLESEGAAEAALGLDTSSAAVAVALGAGRSGRGSKPADRFLARQEELVAKQIHHLDAQFATMRLDDWSKRLRLALQALTMVAGVLFLGAVGWLAWRAHQADGVVIEAFAVPPDMVAKGYSGQALANRIEDRLNDLQAQTFDARPAASYSNNWGHDIKVEIPETGVSLAEIDRMLREWLGHETHIGGDLVRTPQGLSLTIRSEAGGTEVTGDEADMAGLVQKAAEALYARTQPYRYGAYLSGKGRTPEARVVWQKLADEAGPEERAWAFTGLANTETDPRTGIARAREALAIDPNLAPAWLAIANNADVLGDYTGVEGAQAKAVALIQGRGHGGYSDKMLLESHTIAANHYTFTSNYGACANEARSALPLARDKAIRADLEGSLAFCLAHLHETAAARAAQHHMSDVDVMRGLPDGFVSDGAMTAAYVDQDWPALLRESEANEAVLLKSSSPAARAYAEGRPRGMQSLALLKMGRISEGKAMADRMPASCTTDCDGFRAFVLEVAGDYPGADRMRITKAHRGHNPYDYKTAGYQRLEHGDNAGAAAVFAEGTRVGPWYADNWEGWGEALLAKGDPAAAIAKFQEAQKSAPRWAGLHLKWGEALAKLGKRDEARVQFKAAATMDLTPDERVELAAQKV